MKKINDKKLEKIIGGEVAVGVYLAVSSIAIFISGIIYGFTHPNPCKN